MSISEGFFFQEFSLIFFKFSQKLERLITSFESGRLECPVDQTPSRRLFQFGSRRRRLVLEKLDQVLVSAEDRMVKQLLHEPVQVSGFPCEVVSLDVLEAGTQLLLGSVLRLLIIITPKLSCQSGGTIKSLPLR